MISLFHQTAQACSEIVTRSYSTSFSSAIRLLHADLRQPIHSIYGFVRLADEIVDSFHGHDKDTLLARFTADTWRALEEGISLNPILHSFQRVVKQYNIPRNLIHAFLYSMELDLHKTDYNTVHELNEYVYGSAEVVGLMCLCVFCEGDMMKYEALKGSARKLGAAFQKVNFLRDIQSDFKNLNRTYFPDFDFYHFNNEAKARIEADIAKDFAEALPGIRQLPWKARCGVFTAYRYYLSLFKKIKRMGPKRVLQERIRVADYHKLLIVLAAGMRHQFNMI
jgi:phytoene/squalene synthetase